MKPGDDAIHALGLDDVVFEYEITSNRVDCYSVLGIAREAAATFGKEFVPPVVTKTGNSEDAHDYIKVTVEDTDLCPRYCARVVKNIQSGTLTQVDAETSGCQRHPSHQQHCGYHQLRHGRVWPAHACLRSG